MSVITVVQMRLNLTLVFKPCLSLSLSLSLDLCDYFLLIACGESLDTVGSTNKVKCFLLFFLMDVIVCNQLLVALLVHKNERLHKTSLFDLKIVRNLYPTYQATSMSSIDKHYLTSDVPCVVSGWGATDPYGIRDPKKLQYAKLRLIPQDECREKYNNLFRYWEEVHPERRQVLDSSTQLCAGQDIEGLVSNACFVSRLNNGRRKFKTKNRH
jgi:hypothetical protein